GRQRPRSGRAAVPAPAGRSSDWPGWRRGGGLYVLWPCRLHALQCGNTQQVKALLQGSSSQRSQAQPAVALGGLLGSQDRTVLVEAGKASSQLIQVMAPG